MHFEKKVNFIKHQLSKLELIPLDGAYHFISKAGHRHKVVINHTTADWAIHFKVDDYWVVATNGTHTQLPTLLRTIKEVKR